MKKKLVAQLALAGTVGLMATLAAGTAGAAYCNFCHTMHNSQNGQPMRYGGVATPAPVLLLDTCVGCHSGANTTTSLNTSPPRVMALAEPTYTSADGLTGATLAGGDFYWVANVSDAKGHNVVDFGIAGDVALGNTPPGGAAMGSQLQCAGTTGCHGNPAIANSLTALQGAHHTAHGTLAAPMDVATTVGNSYRFLLGTKGAEDSDWQFTQTDTDHNRYAGIIRTASNTNENVESINGLCARCHAAFHNTDATTGGGFYGASDSYGIRTDNSTFATGNWIRHPTDYDMKDTLSGTEYAGYTAYKVEAPVGRDATNLATAGDVVTAGYRIVLCVSCHRAHGSPYDDLLRWRYSDMQVGTNVDTGCMNCHTYK